MGISDTVHFDESIYAIAQMQATDEQLYIDHGRYSLLVLSNYAGSFACIGLAGHTAGLTLAGTAYLTRQLYICSRKMEIIEQEMKMRGLNPHIRPISQGIGQCVTGVSKGLLDVS
ncbi:hypothetical protein FRC17_006689 [Serendipita sp. 399]|nr:hypothetical protein FRC17_006689 [Serendipita sp. 399]